MANKITAYTKMNIASTYTRANGQPLDDTLVWNSLDDAKAYAKTPKAYVGQVITVVTGDEANEKSTVYVIDKTGENSVLSAVSNYVTAGQKEGTTLGDRATAEGSDTIAKGDYSHTEGIRTSAWGDHCHAEGSYTLAKGTSAHAEGHNASALGGYSHAEGYSSNQIFTNADAPTTSLDILNTWGDGAGQKWFSVAYGLGSHVEGTDTLALGEYSHAEGAYSKAGGYASHAEGWLTDASMNYSHAEGSKTEAFGVASHAEGNQTTAFGTYSHAEGYSSNIVPDNFGSLDDIKTSWDTNKFSMAYGEGSHVEGIDNLACRYAAHAEGSGNVAVSEGSHAEGGGTIAGDAGKPLNSKYAHAEGYQTTASGAGSHAEGINTTASGAYSHAEGSNTTASGYYSHAGGYYTKATVNYQTVVGKFNKEDSSALFIVGNGTATAGKNAFVVLENGSAQVGAPSASDSLGVVNVAYLNERLADLGFKKGVVSMNATPAISGNTVEISKLGCWIAFKVPSVGISLGTGSSYKICSVSGIDIASDITIGTFTVTQTYLSDTHCTIVFKTNGDLVLTAKSGNIKNFTTPAIYTVKTTNSSYPAPTPFF